MAGLKMSGLFSVVIFYSMVSSSNVSNSVCCFTNRYVLDPKYVMFMCESATAKDVIREMEYLVYNQTDITDIDAIGMLGNNITGLDEKTFQYEKLSGIKYLHLGENLISEITRESIQLLN